MCGIAGIWNLTGKPVDPDALEQFTRSLAHRGPDGEGFHFEEEGALGLGHRRLAILDPSPAGHQPMSYADERYWITYNGEIYNFLELRQELESHGCRFRTETDTEVILAAYERWGPECQTRFNGMWAFAIWDRKERALFLSRDRFGVKPLYTLSEPGRFAFASEMKAFRHLPDFQPRENTGALLRALVDVFALDGAEETLLQGIRKLRPGHCMRVRPGEQSITRWWNTLDHLTSVPRTLPEQAEGFRDLFVDSCRLRLRSDVPVGTCLSGGLDSSSVVCALGAMETSGAGGLSSARRPEKWRQAFVATFPGTSLDERHYADQAIRRAGVEAHYRAIEPDWAQDVVERAVYSHEDLFFTMPVSYWTIYQEVRRSGVVVSLDGHGADEMLGGYHHSIEAALRSSGSLLRAPVRTLELVRLLHHLIAASGRMAAPSLFRLAVESDPALRCLSRRIGGIRRGLLGASAAADVKVPVPSHPWLRAAPLPADPYDPEDAERIAALGPLNAVLYRAFHHTMLQGILRTFDRCSMAHGVEVRTPFLDWRLVCYTLSLPEESKVGGSYTKRVLREAMRGILPEPLRTRHGKKGFNAPLRSWFLGPLRGWLWDQVNAPDFLASDLWDGRAVRDYVREQQHPDGWRGGSWQRVWAVIHAHLWRQLFLR